MTGKHLSGVGAVAILAAIAAQANLLGPDAGMAQPAFIQAHARHCAAIDDRPVAIPGGTFEMGDDSVYSEEGPVHEVSVKPYRMDRHEVTNRQFAAFVDATGYVTGAERALTAKEREAAGIDADDSQAKPGSAVFVAPLRPSTDYADWWRYVPGANWRKPYGPTGPDAVPAEPVVHLTFADMSAYARWAGGRLPTEAEWEYAARAGGPPTVDQPAEANSWQGVFPVRNTGEDGYIAIAPVGCYAPNGWGLHDMIGNVWEMTADLYTPRHLPADHPRPGGDIPAMPLFDPVRPDYRPRVIKGGSYLCAPNYCRRYRAAARSPGDARLGSSNVGFRLAYDALPPPSR